MFDGPTIFWLIITGLIIGALAKAIMWNSTVSLTINLLMAVAGTLIIGAIMAIVQLPGVTMIAALASIAGVFILNVFNQHTEKAH